MRTHTGTLIADLILTSARNLKERRGPQRALIQRLHNLDFAVAQVGPSDLSQRLFLAVATVSSSHAKLMELLDGAERVIFASDFEVVDLRRLVESDSFHSST